MDQTPLIGRLLALTEEIEAAAFVADWPKAAALNEQRTPLLHSLSAQQSPEGFATIHRIQAIDAAVLENAAVTRTDLEQEFNASMARVKAARQYLTGARL